MIHSLLGFKRNQIQSFTPEGKRIPVTLVQVGPCWVTQINSTDTYTNLQLGFGYAKHITQAAQGHMKKAGLTIQPRFLREIRLRHASDLEHIANGTEIHAEQVFTVGDKVRVTGTSKGKGFAGVVKRHGFAGGPRTHGQSDKERAPGSIGSGTTPGRVVKGKKMAGRMGSDRVTVRGLTVVSIDQENNVVGIKGLVPGARNELLIVEKEG